MLRFCRLAINNQEKGKPKVVIFKNRYKCVNIEINIDMKII
ncbi:MULTISPECIES: hypothetical protein [Thermoanaerobacterium]|nr:MULTISPECIES: hypothetical protein [Thermoanaerobacterium]